MTIERKLTIPQLQKSLRGLEKWNKDIWNTLDVVSNGESKNPRLNLERAMDESPDAAIETVHNIGLTLRKMHQVMPIKDVSRVVKMREIGEQIQKQQRDARLKEIAEMVKEKTIPAGLLEKAGIWHLFSVPEKTGTQKHATVQKPVKTVRQEKIAGFEKKAASKRKPEGQKGQEYVEVYGRNLSGLTLLRKKLIEGLLKGSEVTPMTSEVLAHIGYGEYIEAGKLTLEAARMNVLQILNSIKGHDLPRIGCALVNVTKPEERMRGKLGSFYIKDLEEPQESSQS